MKIRERVLYTYNLGNYRIYIDEYTDGKIRSEIYNHDVSPDKNKYHLMLTVDEELCAQTTTLEYLKLLLTFA